MFIRQLFNDLVVILMNHQFKVTMKYPLIALCILFSFFGYSQSGDIPLTAYLNSSPGSVSANVELIGGDTSANYSISFETNFFQDTLTDPGFAWETGIISLQNCTGDTALGTFNFSALAEYYFVVLDYCSDSVVVGCTDPAALNYDPEADLDDGSCFLEDDCSENIVEVLIETQMWGSEISWGILQDGNLLAEGSGYQNDETSTTFACLEDGCYILQMNDAFGDGWNGAVYSIISNGNVVSTGTLEDGHQGFATFGINATGCDSLIAFGCTDPEALNFDPDADIDDGSCQYPAAENDLCADAIPLNEGLTLINNTNTPNNEGVFGECWNFGSGEGEQSSLWFTITTPAEPAQISIEALGDGTNTFTDTQFGLFEECGGEMIYCDGNSGEGLLSAFNFACGELETNSTYILIVDGWSGDAGTCFLSYEITQPCDTTVEGCTDPEALNFDPAANVDDGSCEYFECDANTLELSITTQNWGGEISWNIVDEAGTEVVGDGNYMNFTTTSQAICLEDGCYTFEMFDSFGDGWNGAEFELSLGDSILAGGTLESGNFGTVAFGVNETGCAPEIFGCTDPEATNYNPLATVDDGSCEYLFECGVSFQVIPDSSGENSFTIIPSENIADAVEVLWEFGDGHTSTELFPTHVYDGNGPYLLCLFVTFSDSSNGFCEISYCEELSGDIFGSPGFLSGGFTVNVIPVGTLSDGTEDVFEEFSIYPNPTDGMTNIHFSSTGTENLQLRISDMTGKLLESRILNSINGEQTITIDLSEHPQGIYILGLEQKGKTTYTKVIRR